MNDGLCSTLLQTFPSTLLLVSIMIYELILLIFLRPPSSSILRFE